MPKSIPYGDRNYHKCVEMSEADISKETISTDPIGPCVFFLLHFTVEGNPLCYLQYYSLIEHDESKWSPQELLQLILHEICAKMKRILNIGSVSPVSQDHPRFDSFQLLVGGGDVKEASKIKSAFSLLNRNDNTTTQF